MLTSIKYRSAAVTLIEILVVVAIIALLVALFYPVLGKVSESRKAAESLSNMRQIGTAVFAYAAEHNYVLPLLDNGPSSSASRPVSWVGSLVHGGYIDAPAMPRDHAEPVASVLRCPGDNGKVRAGGSPAPTSRTDDAGAWVTRWLSTNPETDEVESFQTSYMINGITTQLNNPPFPFVRVPPDAGPSLIPSAARISQPARVIMLTTGIAMHNRVFTNRVNARFGGKMANVIFFDGSARSVDVEEIPAPMDMPEPGGISFRIDLD